MTIGLQRVFAENKGPRLVFVAELLEPGERPDTHRYPITRYEQEALRKVAYMLAQAVAATALSMEAQVGLVALTSSVNKLILNLNQYAATKHLPTQAKEIRENAREVQQQIKTANVAIRTDPVLQHVLASSLKQLDQVLPEPNKSGNRVVQLMVLRGGKETAPVAHINKTKPAKATMTVAPVSVLSATPAAEPVRTQAAPVAKDISPVQSRAAAPSPIAYIVMPVGKAVEAPREISTAATSVFKTAPDPVKQDIAAMVTKPIEQVTNNRPDQNEPITITTPVNRNETVTVVKPIVTAAEAMTVASPVAASPVAPSVRVDRMGTAVTPVILPQVGKSLDAVPIVPTSIGFKIDRRDRSTVPSDKPAHPVIDKAEPKINPVVPEKIAKKETAEPKPSVTPPSTGPDRLEGKQKPVVVEFNKCGGPICLCGTKGNTETAASPVHAAVSQNEPEQPIKKNTGFKRRDAPTKSPEAA